MKVLMGIMAGMVLALTAGSALADQVYCHSIGCVTVAGGPNHTEAGERQPVLPLGVATSINESPPLLAQGAAFTLTFADGSSVTIAPR